MLALLVASHTVATVATMTGLAISALTGVQSTYDVKVAKDANAEARILAGSDRDTRFKQLTAENDQLRTLNQDLRRRNIRLASDFDTYFRSQMRAARETDLKLARSDRLTLPTVRRIQARTAKTAVTNAGSVFAESIPFFGIGFVVAATSFELASSCDTMKDLYDLEVALDPSAAVSETHTEVCGLQVPSADEIWEIVRTSPGKAWDLSSASMNSLAAWADDLEKPDFSGRLYRIWSNVMPE